MVTECDDRIIRDCAAYMHDLGLTSDDWSCTNHDDTNTYHVSIWYDIGYEFDIIHYCETMETTVIISINDVEFRMLVDRDGWAFMSGCTLDPNDTNGLDPITAQHAAAMYDFIDNDRNNIAIDTKFDHTFEFVNA